MKEEYIQWLFNFEELFNNFVNNVIKAYFTYQYGGQKFKVDIKEQFFCYTPLYQQYFGILKRIIEVCDIFGIRVLEKEKDVLKQYTIHLESPESVQDRKSFEFYTNYILNVFRSAKKEIEDRMACLKPEEIDRLNEAIHCFLEGCYYSSVAMSVSAIEFRLFSLMMSICPDPKLEELTLGQLIGEYLDDKQKYGSVIPKKHEPLLDHCNTYRIFSVHPKKEEINKPIASSILNMTFLFLLDKELARKAEEVKAI